MLHRPAVAARIAVGFVVWNTRKIPFFSLLKNSRSEAVSQGHAFLSAPRSGRSEAKSLYGRRSGGYARGSASGMPVPHRSFLFNRFTPQQPRVTAR
jgi:hypothetical protein